MPVIMSNADDCFELAKKLNKELKNHIEFYGSAYQSFISGKFFAFPLNAHSSIDFLLRDGLPFYYKFCQNGFLRIQVGSQYGKNSMGERLAALSTFYKSLKSAFGEPTFFFTIKDDDEQLISLQWSFANAKEDIEKLKKGTYFDDGEIDKLIIMGENETSIDGHSLKDRTKQIIEEQIGLPIELLPLVNDNIDEFTKYKSIIDENEQATMMSEAASKSIQYCKK